MSEKAKINNISFRLNDQDYEKLEFLSNSYDTPIGTLAARLITNVLNENMEELTVNHISFPKPVLKKLFASFDEKQIITLITDTNNYNTSVVKSLQRDITTDKIMGILHKLWRNFGYVVKATTFDEKRSLEIHHEMGKKWSSVVCATTSYTLELLQNKIIHTMVEEDWFKIEYTELCGKTRE